MRIRGLRARKRSSEAGPAPDLMADRPRARWSWRIGVLVLVGILGLPTVGLIGTVHLVRQASESRARQGDATAAAAVGAEVTQSFKQRLRVLQATEESQSLAAGLALENRMMLGDNVAGALADGQYCRLVLRTPGMAPVVGTGTGRCWSPPPPTSGRGGVQVDGPHLVGTQVFLALDLPVTGDPGTTLQGVFAAKSLAVFGLPGAGTHITVVSRTAIVSSTTPAFVGQAVASPASLAMIRSNRPATGTVYAPLIHSRVILAYQPVAGTPFGVFFSVTTKVSYAPAAHLARVLLVGYLVLLGIVVALAGLVLVMIRRRDQATEAATQHYRTLAEATPDGVGIIDDDARLVYANPALIAMLDMGDPDTWLGHRVDELNDLSVDEWSRTRAPVLEHEANGHHRVMNLRHADGHRVPVDINSGPFDLGHRRGVISVIRDLSESRAAEAAAVVAEARQRTTIETVAEGIVVFDLDGDRPVPVQMNPAAVSLWGRHLEGVREMWETGAGPEMIGTDGRPIHLEDLPVAVVARTGEASTSVYSVRHGASEAIRWLRTTANPIRDTEGGMIGIVSSIVDVTAERAEHARVEADAARFAALAAEARASERAQRASEDRFRSAFEHGPIAKALIGLDGRYQQVNQAMCELTGYAEEQLCSRTVADITHPDDIAANAAAMEQLLAGDDRAYALEKRFLTAGGRVIRVSQSSALIRGDDGAPLRFITQLQDITEAREHEEALADERRRLREAQTVGHIGSWEMDIATGVVSWSDTFLELHGVNPDDFVDGPAVTHKWIHPDDADRMVVGFYLCIETGEPMHARYRVIREDDHSLRWFDAYVARRRDGDHLRLSGTTVDVTDLVEAAEQVAAARDEAVEASKQKSAFLATMSHEIRTPMNAVIGMTGLLLDTPLDADQREFVETVRSSGENLLSIINDILDFSKIEAGGLTLEHRPFDLRDCVEEALDLVAATSTAAGLELVGHVDPNCPALVVGDVTRFRQVVVNLLSNAVKFTAHGEVVLRMTADREQAGGGVLLHVAVIDTGIGIPADRIGRLFESFSQVDTSTTRVYGGTGLGLAISQRLVQAMGGLLSVDSTSGGGSTFAYSVTLDKPTPEETRIAQLPDAAPAALHGRSVLVVDDNATNRLSLRLQLERWGMTVTEAGGGPDAIAALESGHHFDVAVLDLLMPEMDGQELAAVLRSAPASSHLPLILLSSPEGRLALPQPDLFSAVVSKPVRAARLEESLVQALGLGQAAPAPRALTGGREPGGRRPLRVLLAEDNAVNQRLGRRLLEKLGDHVDVVGNGREAIEAVLLVPYDVVLMDVEMPVVDGLEATRTIRRNLPADRPIQIIAMTASALVEDRRACYAAGMDDYLAKPVRLTDLDAALAKAAAI